MPDDEVWLPLVDEPIGELVTKIQAADAEIASLISSPRRQLAFRTFAYIRVGILLGQLLIDYDVEPREAGGWVEELLADPKHYAAVVAEVGAVAREVAADPKLVDEEPVGPDAAARERFRAFARKSLGA